MDLNEVKVCLRALLSSNPMSYHVSSLLNDFKSTTGFYLPLFGHLNPVEFLRSLDDTVMLKGDPYNPEVVLVGSEKSAHIISLVDRQRVNDKFGHKNSYFMTNHRRHVVPGSINDQHQSSDGSYLSFQNYSSIFAKEPPQKSLLQVKETNIYTWTSSQPKIVTPATVIISPNSGARTQNAIFDRKTAIKPAQDKSPLKKAVPEPVAMTKTNLQNDKDRCYFEDVDSFEMRNLGPDSSSVSINSSLKNKLQKLIKNYPEGLWCCELPELFYEEYNFALDYREYGCTSLIQMLSELPDVFRVVRPGNGDWIVFDASVAPSEKEKQIVDSQSKGETMSGIKANIQKLLSKFNDKSSSEGVEVDKMAELYQENDIFAEIFPKEVSGPDETFAVLDLTRHIAIGHEVEVCVAEVWSPSKFFVQLNKYKTRLNQFMDELQKFYNVHLTKYKMPDSTLRPNQICVALYNSDPEYPDEWHRAQIMKVINEKTVLINFVDYGTVARVKKSQLRFLHRRFRAFPVQAIRAQLSGVAPPNEEEMWPMTTSKKFLELLRVPYLKAEMEDIDFEIPMLSVILYDPFSKIKSSINKRLVKDKLARAKEPFYFQEATPEKKPPEEEMRSLTTAPSPSEEKKEATKKTQCLNVSFEFEEIPELKESREEEEEEEEKKEEDGEDEKKPEAKKQNPEVDTEVKKVFPKPTPPAPENEIPESTAPPAEVPEENPTPASPQPHPSPPEAPPRKPTRLPPGLEHLKTFPDFSQIPLLLQTQDLKKKVNILAMELLTTNESIKQVGVNDPALALRIATEMAEAYLSSGVAVNLPMGYNLFPLFSQPFLRSAASSPSPQDAPPEDRAGKDLVVTLLPEAPPLPPPPTSSGDPEAAQTQARASGGSESKISPKDNAPVPSPSSSGSKNHVEEIQIGGKTLHLVRVDDEIYFSAEELIRQFTLFSSREIAERLLRTKKFKPDYRLLIEKPNSTMAEALKSCLPETGKRKGKKLKIYLLPVSKTVPFLQVLGCYTKAFESGFLDLQKNRDGKEV